MRKPEDLHAQDIHRSEQHYKTATTTLRRLAGGLEVQLKSELELNDAERKTLQQAIDLLGKMATVTKKTGALSAKRLSDLDALEKRVRAAMSDGFAALTSVEDLVALIGAVNSYKLREDFYTRDLRNFEDAAKESLKSLIYELATKAMKEGRPPEELVRDAWAKFEQGKAAVVAKHPGAMLRVKALTSSLASAPEIQIK